MCCAVNELPPLAHAVVRSLVSRASGPGSVIVAAEVKEPMPSRLTVPRNTAVPEIRSTTPSPFTSAIPHSMCCVVSLSVIQCSRPHGSPDRRMTGDEKASSSPLMRCVPRTLNIVSIALPPPAVGPTLYSVVRTPFCLLLLSYSYAQLFRPLGCDGKHRCATN